jgi:hypothetical protein
MSISQPRHFGIVNRPVCTCGSPMNVIRRSPHPLHGEAYESQTFVCRPCGVEIKRSCGGSGLSPRSESVAAVTPFNEVIDRKPLSCTKCGALMISARTEPAKSGFNLRTFECSTCNNADQYLVEYGTAAPWLLRVRAAT